MERKLPPLPVRPSFVFQEAVAFLQQHPHRDRAHVKHLARLVVVVVVVVATARLHDELKAWHQMLRRLLLLLLLLRGLARGAEARREVPLEGRDSSGAAKRLRQHRVVVVVVVVVFNVNVDVNVAGRTAAIARTSSLSLLVVLASSAVPEALAKDAATPHRLDEKVDAEGSAAFAPCAAAATVTTAAASCAPRRREQ